jgi:uncharacterized protein (UPF0332 family)
LSDVKETKERRIEIAEELANRILKKYEKAVKCIVLFGDSEEISVKAGDIDVFLVLDDTMPLISEEDFEEDVKRVAEEISPQLSVHVQKLTEFWDYARVCHPLVYRIIKTGIPIYDTGFFVPIKRLLELGKIPLTREQIDKFMEDAPVKIAKAKAVKLLMLAEDCYYAMLNTAQAVLMFMDIEPPPPSGVYEEVKRNLVEPGLLKQEYAEWLREIVKIRKKIERRELLDVSGNYVDEWLNKAEKFVNEMHGLLSVLQNAKKVKIIQRTYDVMLRAATKALENVNKLPEKEEYFLQAFKNEFVDKRLIPSYYEEIWVRVEGMKNLADKGEVDKVSYEDVLRIREEVRKFIRDLSKALKKRESNS